MVEGAFVLAHGGNEYVANLTFTVFLSCFFAAIGGLIFRYDRGISGV